MVRLPHRSGLNSYLRNEWIAPFRNMGHRHEPEAAVCAICAIPILPSGNAYEVNEQTNPGPPRRYPANRTTPVHLPVALRMVWLYLCGARGA